LTDHIIWTGGGIDAKEGDELRLIAQLRLKPVLPVPDRGGGNADDLSDIFLMQTEFKAATTEVVTESDGGG
jgi:hypothetical protein